MLIFFPFLSLCQASIFFCNFSLFSNSSLFLGANWWTILLNPFQKFSFFIFVPGNNYLFTKFNNFFEIDRLLILMYFSFILTNLPHLSFYLRDLLLRWDLIFFPELICLRSFCLRVSGVVAPSALQNVVSSLKTNFFYFITLNDNNLFNILTISCLFLLLIRD